VVKKVHLIIGILCFAGAVLMWDHVDSNPKIKDVMAFCNSYWNKIDNGVFDEDCFKAQVYYYSPWLLGIMGIIFLAKCRSHYYGTTYRSHHMLRKALLVIIGISLFSSAALMWNVVDSSSKIKSAMGFCKSYWNKIDNGVFDEDCFKAQLLYYSPWLLGIIGIIFVIKYRPHYYGRRYRSYHRNYGKSTRKIFGSRKVRGPTDWTKNRFRRALGI
jgi:uncharacterized membrane protein YecN with MAPEG domain